ncbi:MAG: hypothetical protein ABL927_06340 [Bdellovibrionales bacterium]
MKLISTTILALSFCFTAWAGNGSELFQVTKSSQMNLTSVTGFWQAPDQFNNNIVFSLRAKIEKNKMTTAIRCDYSGKLSYAEVVTPAQVTDTTIAILANAKGGNAQCNLTASKMPATAYTVENGYLSLEGAPFQFETLKAL